MGMARLPERVAASARSAKSKASALQALPIGATARFGMTPVAASARASAASKSSMFCNVAASSQTARMAALDSIGASRGERAVLMARDLTTTVRSCQSKSAAFRGCETALPLFGRRPSFRPWRALLGKEQRDPDPGGHHGYDDER